MISIRDLSASGGDRTFFAMRLGGDQDITNAIKVRVLGEAQRASRLVVQTSWLFTYGRISLFRALVLLVCLIILIRVVSALACRGIRGAGREGLARAMLAMSGKGGML